MNELLRVPTVAITATVLCGDGRRLDGEVFLPASAPMHGGPMRPDEWLHEPTPFFALRMADGGSAFVNKLDVLAVTVSAADDPDQEDGGFGVERGIVVECLSHRFEGTLVIDMPPDRRRVLDALNGPGDYLTLRDGDKHHIVRKTRITRAFEKA